MSYSYGMGLAFQPTANLAVNAPATSSLTAVTTRSVSAPMPGVSMGFSGEKGRLRAIEIMLRPYLVALQQATLSGTLTLPEKAQLAERYKATRNLDVALAAVQPAAGGWVRRDIEKLQAIAASGNLPTGTDINLLTKSGNTSAFQYAKQIAQAWGELRASLRASGWWKDAPSGGSAGAGIYRGIVGGTLFGGSTGNPAADLSREGAVNAAVAAERAAAEAEAARQRADSEAVISAARAEAAAAAAAAASLQNALAQAQAATAEQQVQLQAALQQAEAAAADAAQRAQAELDSKKSTLWKWGLAALAIGGVGYLVLRKR